MILLDEPFSALDPFTREQMQNHLLHLHGHHGATMVLITHDMDEALSLAHRVIVRAGRPREVVGDFVPRLPKPVDRGSPLFLNGRRSIQVFLSPLIYREHGSGRVLPARRRSILRPSRSIPGR